MDDCKCLLIKIFPANKENKIFLKTHLYNIMSHEDGTQREIKNENK